MGLPPRGRSGLGMNSEIGNSLFAKPPESITASIDSIYILDINIFHQKH
jgi:hypothetical protein